MAWGWGNCLGTIVYNRGGTAKASLFLHRSKEIQGREVCPVRCTYIIGSPGPELRLKREKKPRTGKELHASSVPHSGSNFSAGALWRRPRPLPGGRCPAARMSGSLNSALSRNVTPSNLESPCRQLSPRFRLDPAASCRAG